MPPRMQALLVPGTRSGHYSLSKKSPGQEVGIEEQSPPAAIWL